MWVNSGRRGLEPLVHPNVAVRIGLDPRTRQVEPFRIGRAASRAEEMRDGQGMFVVRSADSGLDLAARRRLDPGDLRSEQNLHPILFQDLPDGVGDVRILPDQELTGALDDGDVAAEPAK